MSDHEPLLFEEFAHDGKRVRLTIEHDGSPILCIEVDDGPLRHQAIRGGEALLMWMQAQAEAALFASRRARATDFPELVKQLEKGEIDLDSFILTADEMGVSRFVVEAVVARGEKEAA